MVSTNSRGAAGPSELHGDASDGVPEPGEAEDLVVVGAPLERACADEEVDLRRDLRLEAEGDVVLRPGKPIGLTGRIAAAQIDLDTLAERRARFRAEVSSSSTSQRSSAFSGSVNDRCAVRE